MTVGEIIKQVKWCIDHETTGFAKLQDNGEDTYMDNIIRAKINDARRWVEVNSGLCVSVASTPDSGSSDSGYKLTIETYNGVSGVTDVGIVTVPDGIAATDIKRVRLKGWHKAAVPVADTENDALMMFDETAKGTADRPLATVMDGSPVRVLVQPYAASAEVEIAYAGVAEDTDVANDSNEVSVASKSESALIYYIAYLLLTAYADGNAQNMLAVAVQSLGKMQK